MTNYQQSWFDVIWRMRGNDIVKEIFRKEFRMYPATFDFIVNIVNTPLERQNTNLRECIPIHKRVAIALWRLATGNQYRVVAKVFGVGITSVYHILIEFCVVLTILAPYFIKLPSSTDECAEIITKFRRYTDCKLPQIVGCIDCTHIRITKPIGEGSADYVNRKHVYSVNTQAVVSERYKFIDVCTGFPGCMHDARVLRNTSLYRRAQNGEIFQEPTELLYGTVIKPMIIGDSAYPPLRWIVKPYTLHRHLTLEERQFNRSLSSTRSIVERAFGILKTRWRCLYKTLEQTVVNVSYIVMACCVLHNICQEVGEQLTDLEHHELLEIMVEDRLNRINNHPICDNFDRQRLILTRYVNDNL